MESGIEAPVVAARRAQKRFDRKWRSAEQGPWGLMEGLGACHSVVWATQSRRIDPWRNYRAMTLPSNPQHPFAADPIWQIVGKASDAVSWPRCDDGKEIEEEGSENGILEKATGFEVMKNVCATRDTYDEVVDS